jgi:hypothetical protein
MVIINIYNQLAQVQMTKPSLRKSALLILAAVTLTPLVAHAQFGNLMQQLQKMQPPAQQSQTAPPVLGGSKGSAKGALAPSD